MAESGGDFQPGGGAIGAPKLVTGILASALLIAPAVSSYMSASVYALIVLGWALYARGLGRPLLEPAERLIVQIFAAYFVIGAVRGLLAANPAGALSQLAPNLVFLLAGPLFPLLRRNAKAVNWEFQLSILAAGGLAIGLYALFHSYAVAREFDPPTGNPLILALFCGLAGLALFERAFLSPGRIPWLHIAGFAGATLAIWLTARRSVILAYLICALILLAWSAARMHWARLAAALAIVAVCAGAAPTGEAAVTRLTQTKPMSAEISPDGSTGDLLRRSMLLGGVRAFLAHPVMGYGRQNAVKAANDLRSNGDPPFDQFNHLHSAPLTEAVSAGILGLAAYLALFATPLIALRKARGGLFRTAAASVLFFALCSILNVGFYVDATASVFVLAVGILNALARQAAPASPPSAPAAS